MNNGILRYAIVTGGGVDSKGDSVPVVTTWSDPIDCLTITNTHNNRGKYADGVFTTMAYEVHIDMQEFTASRIKLENNRGIQLGEFTIQEIRFLDLVHRIKIIV